MNVFAKSPLQSYCRRIEILAVLEQRDFRYLWAAYIISHAGDAAYMFAIIRVIVEDVNWPEGKMAAITAAIIPILFMPPIAGVLADRLDRKSLMLFAHVVRVPILVALFVVGHVVGLGLLYVAAAGFAVTAAGQLFYPARAAMVPNLLARHKLVAGNAALMAGRDSIGLAGIAIGGLLGAALGGLNALGFAAVAFGLAALLIYRMESPQRAPSQPTSGSGVKLYVWPVKLVEIAVRDIAFTVYFICTHPLLRAVAIVGVLFVALVSSPIVITVPQLLGETISAGASGYDIFTGLRDVWVFLALPAVPWLARRLGDGTMGVLAFAAMGGLLGVLAVVGQQWQAFAVAALLGVLIAGMLPLRSIVQAETPDRLRGRVIGILATVNLLASLGVVLFLADTLDVVEAEPILPMGGILVLVAGAVLLSLREIREARLSDSERV